MIGNQVTLCYEEGTSFGGNQLRIRIWPSDEGRAFVALVVKPERHEFEIDKSCHIALQDFETILGDILDCPIPFRPPEDLEDWLDGGAHSFSISSAKANFSMKLSWSVDLPPEWSAVGACLDRLWAFPAVKALMKAVTKVRKDRVRYWRLEE